MFSYIITYAVLLLLSAPYMAFAAPNPLEPRAITGIRTSLKYQKNPTVPFQISYGACTQVPGKFSGYQTGKEFYNNVLKPGVWLAGGFMGDCGTGCGRCHQLKDTSGNPINMYFFIVDYEASLTTAPGALTALQALTSNYNGALTLVANTFCVDPCTPPAGDPFGCESW
ncbi:hypothetical protein TWF481_001435 [Arthrobotrys musiformis]|uniref:Uncharacterized protein n=1 Tax=Arthrobotrys musiformis TaxID=47236 RepID=A0AAV9WQI2_9PEZI